MNLNKQNIELIKPLQDRILIKRIEEEQAQTSGGIYIPEGAKEKTQIGKVIAVGEGKPVNGNRIPLSIKTGDTVFFSKFAGTEINNEYLLIREDEALALLS